MNIMYSPSSKANVVFPVFEGPWFTGEALAAVCGKPGLVFTSLLYELLIVW